MCDEDKEISEMSQICQCGYTKHRHVLRVAKNYSNWLCPYSLYLGHNSQFRTLGGVFTYSVGFNND
jgi:hypothetical protein